MYQFSPSTGGFYHADVHDRMPDDVQPVTEKRHTELMAGQTTGKRIVADAKGAPVLDDQLSETADQAAARDQHQARACLAETDWYFIRQLETGRAVPQDISARRAAARQVLG